MHELSQCESVTFYLKSIKSDCVACFICFHTGWYTDNSKQMADKRQSPLYRSYSGFMMSQKFPLYYYVYVQMQWTLGGASKWSREARGA